MADLYERGQGKLVYFEFNLINSVTPWNFNPLPANHDNSSF